MDIEYELIILDSQGCYFDLVGEYDSLESAIKSKDTYQAEYPEDKYSIIKVTRETIE